MTAVTGLSHRLLATEGGSSPPNMMVRSVGDSGLGNCSQIQTRGRLPFVVRM
jgi:hypothetical protein